MISYPIILMGFKHVGKSVIGRELAMQLGVPFVDLDQKIEQQQLMTCREIMQAEGEDFFRQLEHQMLEKILNTKQSVISLGGGTPLYAANQHLLKPHYLVHITAPRGVVFERIMLNGRPAFFSPDEEPLNSFNRLWEAREKVYQMLAKVSVDNKSSIADAVAKLLEVN